MPIHWAIGIRGFWREQLNCSFNIKMALSVDPHTHRQVCFTIWVRTFNRPLLFSEQANRIFYSAQASHEAVDVRLKVKYDLAELLVGTTWNVEDICGDIFQKLPINPCHTQFSPITYLDNFGEPITVIFAWEDLPPHNWHPYGDSEKLKLHNVKTQFLNLFLYTIYFFPLLASAEYKSLFTKIKSVSSVKVRWYD